MIIDGNEYFRLHPTDIRDCDLCIVGGGAAGITLAVDLSRRTPSLRVVVLEGGGDAPGGPGPSPYNPLYAGEVVGDMQLIKPDFLTASRYRAFGGSTNCWGAWCRPLDAVDLEGHGGFPRWPVSPGELAPFYREAQKACSLGPYEYGPAYWAARSRGKLVPLPGSDVIVDQVCIQGVQNGWKQFGHNYWAALAAAPNVRVLQNSNLVRIESEHTGGMDHVEQLEGRTLLSGSVTPGVRFTVKAARYVVALGGIESVRALLNSPSASQPRGLGNNGDLVGRYFNVHPVVPEAGSGTFAPREGWPPQVRDFFAPSCFPIDGSAEDAPVTGLEMPDYEIAESGASQECVPPGHRSVYAWTVLAPTARALHGSPSGSFRVMLGGGPDNFSMNVCWEQQPAHDSRLTLAETRDVFGNRQVRVEWKLSRHDEVTYTFALSQAQERVRGAGYVITTFTPNPRFQITERSTWAGNMVPGDHPMGGTRMSASPADGVVDPNCKLHSMSNLYVSSSSNWPSGGWANPTLTIVAMAIRLADHLTKLAAADVTVRIDQAEIAVPVVTPEGDA
jgi:choline dehydrogenase-like flavoprotein